MPDAANEQEFNAIMEARDEWVEEIDNAGSARAAA